jgi:hypothetical protein
MNQFAMNLRLFAHPFAGPEISDEFRNTLIKAAEEIDRLESVILNYAGPTEQPAETNNA